MLGLTAIQARYTPFKPSNNEEFSSASRSVKPGLIASGIVSAWTWAATLVCAISPYAPFHHPVWKYYDANFRAPAVGMVSAQIKEMRQLNESQGTD